MTTGDRCRIRCDTVSTLAPYRPHHGGKRLTEIVGWPRSGAASSRAGSPKLTTMRAALRPFAVLAALVLLGGCGGSSSDISGAQNPSSSLLNRASTTRTTDVDETTTVRVDVTPTTTATTSPTTSVRGTPSSSPSGSQWPTQHAGEVLLEEFVGELAAADRFRVDRHERLTMAGKSLVRVQEFIVDLDKGLVGGTVSYASSDMEMAEMLLGAGDISLEDLETQVVMDQSGNAMRILMTFPHQWDGKWLEIKEDDAPMPGVFSGVAPESHVAGFVEVAAVPVSGFKGRPEQYSSKSGSPVG